MLKTIRAEGKAPNRLMSLWGTNSTRSTPG